MRLGEEGEEKRVSESFSAAVNVIYVMGVPSFRPVHKREGKQIPSKSVMCHACDGVARA